MKLNDLKPLERNPFKLKGDAELETLKKNIQGFEKMLSIRKIVIDENNTIWGGNKRYFALKSLGYKEIPDDWIDKRTDLTEQEKKKFAVLDNVGFGEWQIDILNDWNVPFQEWGVELINESEPEILDANEDDFDVTEGGIETDIVIGDLFEIGEHRLLCGDSTDSAKVAKLMNDKKADMVFTDPPYDLENENYHSNIYLFTENAHIFLMHDDKGIVNYLRLSKLEFERFYVANFGFSSPRGNDPYLSHILVSQEKNGKAMPHKNMYDGFRSIITMEYRFRLKDDKTEHKHQKSIKFISIFIEHFSKENSIIFDLFLGSGSTMVAAHQLKRKCYGMELDPKYCQVIIDRMRKLDTTLVIKKNGVII